MSVEVGVSAAAACMLSFTAVPFAPAGVFKAEANQSNSPLVELKPVLLPAAAIGVTSGVPAGVADGKDAWVPKISAVSPASK